MTIENHNSQEQNQEFDAGVKAKEGISNKNTDALAEDLNKELLDNPVEQILQSKINFLIKSNAGNTDKAKGIYLENQTEGMTQEDAISKILKLSLVSENDIRSLTKDQLTRLIQTKMYEKIALNPEAYAKLNNYLQSESKIKGLNIGMPNAGSQILHGKTLPASDGIFGPRSYFILDLLINIPPTIVPEKPKDTPPEKVEEKIITYEPKYTINVRGDAADGAYFFVDTEDQYQNFIKQYPTIFSSAVIQAKSNTIEQEHLGVTINSTKNGFEENIKDYAKSSDVLGPFKRIGDTQEKQQVLRAAGKLRKDDFGNMVPDKVDNRHIFKHEKSKQYTIVRAQ